MRRSMFAMLAAAALPLAAACTPVEEEVAEAPPPPAAPNLPPVEGAMLGYPAGSLPGAVWADRDADGFADGYYYGGRYYQGRPPEAPAASPVRRGERG